MPLSDRDYIRGKHPPSCTCVDCVNKRMKKLGIKSHKSKTNTHHATKVNSDREFRPVTNTQIKTGREYSRSVKIISNIIIFLIVISILGLLGGGIYAVAKYHGNAFHWVSQEYHSVARDVSKFTSKTSKSVSNWFETVSISVSTTQATPIDRTSPIITSTIPSLTSITPKATTPLAQPTNDNRIDPKTGSYKNYYLGLVNDGGFISGDGCYDDTGNFIVLINNKNATNPTYNQLVSFLQNDKTDEFPYIYTNRPLGFYYGTAESHVDLARVKSIIDGTVQPNAPDVCADFAERLHNDAELAGVRCAYVSISLSGYPDPYHLGIPSNSGHALDAFQTVDRGLVYIDDTNELGPARSVTTVNVVVGQAYIPNLLFNDAGWLSTSMGTVTNVKVVWDGTWNN